MLASVTSSSRFGRYSVGAGLYDVLSLERPVYRAGRLAGIELLRLQAGARVLDLGCGTGLNFPVLASAIGPRGQIVGVDRSAQMLTQAQARVRRHGWANVRLVQADAGAYDMGELIGGARFDAVVATYALSIFGDGPAAWRSALAAMRPAGRVAVVDLALPTGRWAALAPLARLACLTGGVDLARTPWRWVVRDTDEVEQRVLRAGHIRVACGTVPAGPPAAP